MINGIGVVGWGVGGIEAEAGMLGQPVYFLTPDVVGVELTGKLREGVTATDLVLTVTEMLRKAKVVGKFVEFFGEGAASLSVPDRATIANMAPEYGATMGFFPVDDATVDYLTRDRPHATRRSTRSTSYFKAQGLFGMPRAGEIDYTKARDARPRDRQAVARRAEAPAGPHRAAAASSRTFTELFSKPVADNGFAQTPDKLARALFDVPMARRRRRDRDAQQQRPRQRRSRATSSRWSTTGRRPIASRRAVAEPVDIGNGDVLIAAITSCTNTSNPERAARRRPAREEGGREGPDGQAAHQDLARARLARGHRVPDARPGCCRTSRSSASTSPPTAARPASATPAT